MSVRPRAQRTAFGASGLLALTLLAACLSRPDAEAPPLRAPLELDDATVNAFSLPLPGLAAAERKSFFVGNSFFNQNWVSAPSSIKSRDGLGPLFNARSCSACHFKDGRGRPPEAGELPQSMLVRISRPGRGEHGAPVPDSHYGDQLQGEAIGGVRREAEVRVRYRELAGAFADGEPYSLRAPELTLDALGHGPLADGLMTSARVAPALVGLGLLEAVPEAALRQREDPDDRDGDGVSGRASHVPSTAHARVELGRFGWKAEQPSVLDQTAAAFVGDMGITSALLPNENHTAWQKDCLERASGGTPELTAQVLESVVLYVRTLAVPSRRAPGEPDVQRGERLFEQLGCVACHAPSLTTSKTAEPVELAERTIHPYTDLLLHDLGEPLSDHRPSFSADGAEWRTAPLWGIGLLERVNGHSFLLHDGRARGLREAILWHGGEAEKAKRAFVRLSQRDRAALLAFLESL